MVTGLTDIESVVVREKTEVLERRFRLIMHLKARADLGVDLLGDGFIGTGHRKIVNLAKEEDLVTLVGGVVDSTVMRGALEVQFRRGKNAVDVLFPQTTGFGMTLEGM